MTRTRARAVSMANSTSPLVATGGDFHMATGAGDDSRARDIGALEDWLTE
ncbi:MAG: hypothetical protein ACRD2W_22450 [Acidimicrobiales bacterium]